MSRRTKSHTRLKKLSEVNDKLKKGLTVTLKLLVSAAMLWFVFSKIDIDRMVVLIQNSSAGYLLAALICFILSKWVSAYRLNIFFSATGLHIPARTNNKLYLLGMFYNLFLPGGIGGDAYKIFLLNRHHAVKLRHVFLATLLDRVTGLIALVILAIILTWWLPLPNRVHLMLALAIPLIIGISWFVIRRYFTMFRRTFAITNLQSLLVQGLQLISALCILTAIHQHQNQILLLTLFLVSSVMAVIPFTFGGAGAREFTFAITGSLLAFDQPTADAAIALGLIFYLITAITSLAGIWYLFFPIHMVSDHPSIHPQQ
jgi:glycosyltransferase 2 family protein